MCLTLKIPLYTTIPFRWLGSVSKNQIFATPYKHTTSDTLSLCNGGSYSLSLFSGSFLSFCINVLQNFHCTFFCLFFHSFLPASHSYGVPSIRVRTRFRANAQHMSIESWPMPGARHSEQLNNISFSLWYTVNRTRSGSNRIHFRFFYRPMTTTRWKYRCAINFVYVSLVGSWFMSNVWIGKPLKFLWLNAKAKAICFNIKIQLIFAVALIFIKKKQLFPLWNSDRAICLPIQIWLFPCSNLFYCVRLGCTAEFCNPLHYFFECIFM